MSEDISKLIGNMLQNPDALKNLLGSVSGSDSNEAVSQESETNVQNIMSALNQNNDRRITLLNALKPYMRGQRAEGIDRAIRLLQISKLSEIMRNERN